MVEWWSLGGVLVASTAMTYGPSHLVLKFGGYSAGQHWSHNARLVATVSGIVQGQPYALALALLLPMSRLVHSLWPRLVYLAAVLLGWYAGVRLIAKPLRREHDYPKPVVPLEAERAMLLRFGTSGAMLPLITVGLDLDIRLLASTLGLVVTSCALLFWAALLRSLGLLGPLPPEVSRCLGSLPPGVRLAAVRSSEANAVALPIERMVLITTGALQRLEPQQTQAVVAHELSHLREGFSSVLLRALPRCIGVALAVLIALIPRSELLLPITIGAYIISLVLAQRRSIRKERRADRSAQLEEERKGDYARALLALHEACLMPATLPKQASHPSLYDRLKAAGMKPGFPRPAVPSNEPVYWSFAVSAVVMLTLGHFAFSERGTGAVEQTERAAQHRFAADEASLRSGLATETWYVSF